MRQFKGTLNSRLRTGVAYFGNQDEIRFRKLMRVDSLTSMSMIWRNWYKPKWWRFSRDKAGYLFRNDKEIYRNQREYNRGKIHKPIRLFPWR